MPPAREAESVRARRQPQVEGGEEEFRVRWKGCTWEMDTWEPKSAVADELIVRFAAMEEAQRRAFGDRRTSSQRADGGSRAGGAAAKKKGSSFVRF